MSVEKQKEKENSKDDAQNAMQMLEDALLLCKFGKFHMKLMMTTLAAVFASTMVTTSSSYILPSAECDLKMTLMQKGLLNAMPFVGQVGSALFTGFLTDAFGRKFFLVIGNLGIFLMSILEGTSQVYWMLVVGKLIEGIFLSLCVSATSAMVTEFTHKGVRDRVLMVYSAFFSTSLIMAACLSWAILPQPWHFVLWEGYFELRAWNIYLYICSIWSLIASIAYYRLPESPKYLLSHGQENKALDILKMIYSENTGEKPESFPITSLNVDGVFVPTTKISFKKQMVESLYDIKDLFRPPLLCRLLLFCFITFVSLLAYSSLRLWYPQLSTIVENFNMNHGEGTAQFCDIINDYRNNSIFNIKNTTNEVTGEDVCVPQLSGSETYINGIIMGAISFTSMGISGYLVDFCGAKLLMFTLLLVCSICSTALYWTSTSLEIALLISAACALMQTAMCLQNNIIVRVFPTTVRTLTLSIILMTGRIGSLLGSILFPVLLAAGCMGPFVLLSVITLVDAAMIYFLPDPNASDTDK